MLFPSFFNAGPATYEIEQSLRFRGNNTYFTKTFGSSGDRRKFTLSVWVKKATVTAVSPNNTGLNFFGANSGSVGDSMNVGMNADTTAIQFYQYNSGYAGGIFSDARYRDPSAWMHVVFVWDSAQATASDRMAVYVNNRVERPDGSAGSPDTAPSQNKDAAWNNSSYTHTIGGTNQTNDMYIAEAYHIDGQALDPSSFGEYDSNGVWRPIKYTGTYSGNSFYLKFDPSATNGIGHDHSGLGNNWSPTGFSTSGTGTDVMSDTPTKNFNTLNPAIRPYTATPAEVLSDGNLKLSCNSSSVSGSAWSTMLITSGKWYWEGTLSTAGASNNTIGWSNSTEDAGRGTNVADLRTNGVSYVNDGDKDINTTKTSYGDSFTTGDVIGAALDADAGTITFYKNGVSQGDITGQSPQSDSAGWLAAVEGFNGTVWDVNFGQRDFAYTPPTGFKALNTSNLPAPTVKDGSDNFNTVLWTGNATARDITTGHNSNFTWIKHRNSAENHNLYDILRGTGNRLESNSTSQETSYADRLTAFNSDGFSLGTGYNNTNGTTYVGWSWAGGGSGSSNTDGSITSTVSANPSAGFSIVSFTGKTYTGNSSTDTGTVGHGLGVAPSFYVVKARNGTSDWICYHSALGNTKYIELSQQNSATTNTGMWASTSPTSTVFTMGPFWPSNIADGKTMIAYCFAEVEGYSKFGSYTGNGSSDGPFVHTGFKPAWLMVKKDAGSTDWKIYDAGREPYNVVANRIAANTSNTELDGNAQDIDFLSNGFKFRGTNGDQNSSGTFYYVAFAENPFGGSGVSPATAR